MYYPQAPKEPGGCSETLLITRIVFGMLLVPFLMVFGAIFAIVLAFYALSVHPLLAVLVFVLCFAAIALVAKWEAARVKAQMPPEDQS